MNNFRLQIKNIFKGSAKSFYRFPAAIVSALIISIISIIRIKMDWETQQTYELLFTSIQMSFILAAAFSMAIVVLGEVRSKENKSFFILGKLSGLVLAAISFILLYFYGGIIGEDNTAYLSSIAMARINVAILISVIGYIYILSKAKTLDSFSDAFFISHRAFMISAIYGGVMMLGVSGVVGAFQALIYRDMDYRIYQYIGVIVGFITFTIFLGYFPSFKGRENEEEINKIKEQPRFIFILFEYILIPIMMALTLVLLIWSVRVIFQGIDVSFNQLSGIASAYVIIGIWLHIMVSKHNTKISKFYKKAYPFAGILILIFEAWALYVQLNKLGLKTAEYSFLMIWIFAIISIFFLIFLKNKAYRKISIVAIIISIIWVMPIIGYEDATFNSQVNRLEEILINEELLINDNIVAANKEVEYIRKGEITEAVDFISYSEKENTPNWFRENLNDEKVFNESFGFEKTYGVYEDQLEYRSMSFILKEDPVDISDYSISLRMLPNYDTEEFNFFEGQVGDYKIINSSDSSGIPKITVELDDRIIMEEDMSMYLSELVQKYTIRKNRDMELAFEDMSFILEDENISILFVFSSINININEEIGETDYYMELHGVFIKYK